MDPLLIYGFVFLLIFIFINKIKRIISWEQLSYGGTNYLTGGTIGHGGTHYMYLTVGKIVLPVEHINYALPISRLLTVSSGQDSHLCVRKPTCCRLRVAFQ